MANGDRDWDFHLRILSNSARDSNLANDPASDTSLLQSVKKLYKLCKAESSEDLVARVYPHINKLFQRSVASMSQSQSRTSNGLLLLAILQFFLDFGEMVLHDADPSLRAFFRTCLSREFADFVVAEATLNFLNLNKKRLLSSFPNLLPQKPIMDRLGEAYDTPARAELALQLCWAIGEHGGGGELHKDAARELFESLELLLYENLSSSCLGMRQESAIGSTGENFRKSLQSRLLCFVITAIAKLATYHRELLPRARVSLGKVHHFTTSQFQISFQADDRNLLNRTIYVEFPYFMGVSG